MCGQLIREQTSFPLFPYLLLTLFTRNFYPVSHYEFILQECPAYPGNKKRSGGFEWPTTPNDDCSTFLREVLRYMGHMFWKVDVGGCGNWHALLFFIFLFFLEHFAHFHFRSHLQSLINRESHQIKLEQSQRCRPEANWCRRLFSPATSRSYPSPLMPPPPPPLCVCSLAIITKGKDLEALSPSTVSVPQLPLSFLPCVRMHVRTSGRQAEPEVSAEVSNGGIWRAAEWLLVLLVTPVL